MEGMPRARADPAGPERLPRPSPLQAIDAEASLEVSGELFPDGPDVIGLRPRVAAEGRLRRPRRVGSGCQGVADPRRGQGIVGRRRIAAGQPPVAAQRAQDLGGGPPDQEPSGMPPADQRR